MQSKIQRHADMKFGLGNNWEKSRTDSSYCAVALLYFIFLFFALSSSKTAEQQNTEIYAVTVLIKS
jgi:hypothetical protein